MIKRVVINKELSLVVQVYFFISEMIKMEEETSISLTENQYRPNQHFKWLIQSEELLEPRLVFRYAHLAEFKFQEQRFCDNDRLIIQHGSEFTTSCGQNQTLSNKAFYTNNNQINITFKSDDIISGQGFFVSFSKKIIERRLCLYPPHARIIGEIWCINASI